MKLPQKINAYNIGGMYEETAIRAYAWAINLHSKKVGTEITFGAALTLLEKWKDFEAIIDEYLIELEGQIK